MYFNFSRRIGNGIFKGIEKRNATINQLRTPRGAVLHPKA